MVNQELFGKTGIKQCVIQEIIHLAQKYDVQKVILFGSRARGDYKLKSDIDLAIYSNSDIFEFIEEVENTTHTLLEFDFSDMNKVKDDFFIEQIKKDGIIIYEKCRI